MIDSKNLSFVEIEGDNPLRISCSYGCPENARQLWSNFSYFRQLFQFLAIF